MIKNIINTFMSAAFAGIAISIGCIIFLTMGGIIGATLFAFGLLTVVHYGLKLYTGTVGFMNLMGFKKENLQEWGTLFLVIAGNVIGCLLTAFLASCGDLHLDDSVTRLYEARMGLTPFAVIVRAMGCGLIMTTAVRFARDDKFLPLLFGVPLFICAGFLHSIADSFYYAFNNVWTMKTFGYLSLTYFGNYLGCSAYKAFIGKYDHKLIV